MQKKKTSMILAAVLIIVSLTGCGGYGNKMEDKDVCSGYTKFSLVGTWQRDTWDNWSNNNDITLTFNNDGTYYNSNNVNGIYLISSNNELTMKSEYDNKIFQFSTFEEIDKINEQSANGLYWGVENNKLRFYLYGTGEEYIKVKWKATIVKINYL